MLGMNLTAGYVFAGFILGLIGMFLLIYGKKQGHFWHIVIGLALSILPMAVTDVLSLWACGAALTVLAWYLR